jgi:hypothetical protein
VTRSIALPTLGDTTGTTPDAIASATTKPQVSARESSTRNFTHLSRSSCQTRSRDRYPRCNAPRGTGTSTMVPTIISSTRRSEVPHSRASASKTAVVASAPLAWLQLPTCAITKDELLRRGIRPILRGLSGITFGKQITVRAPSDLRYSADSAPTETHARARRTVHLRNPSRARLRIDPSVTDVASDHTSVDRGRTAAVKIVCRPKPPTSTNPRRYIQIGTGRYQRPRLPRRESAGAFRHRYGTGRPDHCRPGSS